MPRLFFFWCVDFLKQQYQLGLPILSGICATIICIDGTISAAKLGANVCSASWMIGKLTQLSFASLFTLKIKITKVTGEKLDSKPKNQASEEVRKH